MGTNHSNRFSSPSENGSMHLELEVCDPAVVGFLEQFEGPARSAKALEALRFGVGVLQTSSPTMDLQMVKDEFGDLHVELKNSLANYFKDEHGILPRSLNGYFGENGTVTRALLDPNNKKGVLAMIEERVTKLTEGILKQFSLDEDTSAISRLRTIFADGFASLKQSLGIKEAQAAEAERGHVKGFEFEVDLYDPVAQMGRQFGDETELVRGSPGSIKNCKTGDHLIILGETTGAPGLRIVVEAKDQDYKAKDAIAELQKAKKNREAVAGIFVFAKGCEPPEFGNFRRVDNDFYCTADKSALAEGGPLPFVWAAYELARVQAVAAVRKEAGGKLDLERIQQHIDGIAVWVPRLGEIMTKASTVQNNGKFIETTAKDIKDDIEKRAAEVLALLRLDAE